MEQQVTSQPTVPQFTTDFSQEATLVIRDRAQEIERMPLEDIAKIFLTPSEIAKCYSQIHTATLMNRWNFSYGSSAANHWKQVLRDNPKVTWVLSYKFEWSKARKQIMKKYGFIEVNYVGNKTSAIGLKLKTSFLDEPNPELHIKHLAEVRKVFKEKTANACYLDIQGCITQTECNPIWMRKLMEYSK